MALISDSFSGENISKENFLEPSTLLTSTFSSGTIPTGSVSYNIITYVANVTTNHVGLEIIQTIVFQYKVSFFPSLNSSSLSRHETSQSHDTCLTMYPFISAFVYSVSGSNFISSFRILL